MKAFLQLIRWPNLIIVVLTMILMRYAVIAPVISKIGVVLTGSDGAQVPMTLRMPLAEFILLVLATVFLTAGGYVINDYFDVKTDLINKGKVIVGTSIPRNRAMMWHNIFNIAGVGIGFYISWRAGYFWLGTMFLVVSGLLYFYSASYKRQFLIGNLVVAILVAMVPLLVAIYEWPALYRFYSLHTSSIPDISFVFYWVCGFAVFAFLSTLTREIIKDIEDFEGDKAYGRNTIPVILGVLPSKIVSVSLVLLTIALLFLVWHFFVNDFITLIYLSSTIVLPLLWVVWRVAQSSTRKHLHGASRVMKFVMLTGILYSVVVKIILTWNLF
jgi:4-hydroxybenzoate polyprenyltransferase